MATQIELVTESPPDDDYREQQINTQVALTTGDDFKTLTEIEHVRQRPDMYIGQATPYARDSWVLSFMPNQETGQNDIKANKQRVIVSAGLERIFLEILSNAGDNAEKSRRTEEYKNKVGKISVEMDRNTITIKNGGVPIPIEMQGDLLVPEKAFGSLRTGTNFSDDDAGSYCGRNGYGAKLTNIFSTRFEVKATNPLSKLQYHQVWENGMTVKHPAQVSEYNGKDSMVSVTFTSDFRYFGADGYADDEFFLYAMHVANVGFLHKIPVTFNSIDLKSQDIRSFGKLLFGEELMKSAVIHYEWPKRTQLVERNGTMMAKDKHARPIVEMLVLDTPDAGQQLSFVNGMITRDGGEHVNAAYRSISETVLTAINKKCASKKPSKDGKTTNVKLTITDVKPHLTLLLNVKMVKPVFKSQTKTELAKFGSKIKTSEKLQKRLLKWDLIRRLQAAVEAKQFRNSKKSDGKKQRRVKDDKAIDCNWAGTKKSNQCSAILVEGLSAMGYAKNWVSNMQDGCDKFGVLPLRGKPLNARNADAFKVSDNKVFIRLKKFLGLQEGRNYLNDEDYQTLRYGYIMILTDADQDGDHIKGLVLLYLNCYHPTLLQRGCVFFIRTPILRAVISQTENVSFYSVDDYKQWVAEDPRRKNVKVNFYKGLGTSTDDEVKQDVKSPKIAMCVYDEQAPIYFELAFNSKCANQRKEWLAQIKDKLNIVHHQQVPISLLIDQELIEYSRANNERSIPELTDGLKPGQRKIMYAALYKSGGGKTPWTFKMIKDGKCSKRKVAQFGNAAAAETNYHHGEACLHQTIVGMTQSFAGANNMPYFIEDGQFGTRGLLGKDAADPRYIYTRPQKWLPYVFRKEDEPIYNLIEEEGETVEPETLMPIIPMYGPNGAIGIGTAWSTYIPQYNPMEIAQWFINRLTGQPSAPLQPYYRGFNGKINIVPRNKKAPKKKEIVDEDDDNDEVPDVLQVDDDAVTAEMMAANDELAPKNGEPDITQLDNDDEFMDDEVPDQVDVNKVKAWTMEIVGTYEIDGNTTTITELPLGRSFLSYGNWLIEQEEKKTITHFDNYSGPNQPRFVLKGMKKPSVKKLRLIKRFGLSNMVLMHKGVPKKYANIEEAFEAFFGIRLGYYEQRKAYILGRIGDDVQTKNEMIRFIEAVAVHKTIIVMNQTKARVKEQMVQQQIAVEIYDKVKLTHCSVEEIAKLRGDIEKLQEEHSKLAATSGGQIWVNELWEFMQMYQKHHL